MGSTCSVDHHSVVNYFASNNAVANPLIPYVSFIVGSVRSGHRQSTLRTCICLTPVRGLPVWAADDLGIFSSKRPRMFFFRSGMALPQAPNAMNVVRIYTAEINPSLSLLQHSGEVNARF